MWVADTSMSMLVCDHGFCLCDHVKSRLVQDLTQAVMVYSVMRFNLVSFNFEDFTKESTLDDQ